MSLVCSIKADYGFGLKCQFLTMYRHTSAPSTTWSLKAAAWRYPFPSPSHDPEVNPAKTTLPSVVREESMILSSPLAVPPWESLAATQKRSIVFGRCQRLLLVCMYCQVCARGFENRFVLIRMLGRMANDMFSIHGRKYMFI